jgi:hypothetical protein
LDVYTATEACYNELLQLLCIKDVRHWHVVRESDGTALTDDIFIFVLPYNTIPQFAAPVNLVGVYLEPQNIDKVLWSAEHYLKPVGPRVLFT